MTNQIVVINVSVQVAPSPSNLQQTGAFLSQGATTLAAGTYQLLTTSANLTSILTGTLAITSITWASNVATVTTAAPHGYPVGDVVKFTITGATPAGYNGTFNCTITTTTAFTFPLLTNPGTETIPGVYTPEDVSELVAMNNTFWAQGTDTPVYVLELGKTAPTDGVAALVTFIAANPNFFYAYLVPRTWDGNAAFLTLLASYENTTAKTYFYTTTTISTYSNYTALMKDVFALVEAPTVAAAAVLGTATEFSCAAPFQWALGQSPSPTSLVPPMCFAYMYGVTPYPTAGNSTLFVTLKAANINWIYTGAEGGISNTLVEWGLMADGNPWNYWYSVDWVQINLDLNLANAIINGSNNPLAPLYYNQNGIDTLQAVAQQTMKNGISYGLVLGPVTVTAVPFITWVTANPSAYKAGTYGGFSVTFSPARGFSQITFQVVASDLVL